MTPENDANEDALQRLKANGDDLSRPRNIEFTVVFPNESVAEQFADHFRQRGYSVSVELTDTAEGLPWDVVIVKNMSASAHQIAEFERTLEELAAPLSGRNDGWGCLSTNS